jgi:hypothetical protein
MWLLRKESIIESKDTEMAGVPDIEFKSLTLKHDQGLQREFKQTEKWSKSIQDMNEKVSNMDEKLSKEIEILRKKWKWWKWKAQ